MVLIFDIKTNIQLLYAHRLTYYYVLVMIKKISLIARRQYDVANFKYVRLLNISRHMANIY